MQFCSPLGSQTDRVFLLSWLPWGLTQGFRKYLKNKASWPKEYVFSCSKQIAISLVCPTNLREDRTVMWFLGGKTVSGWHGPGVTFYPHLLGCGMSLMTRWRRAAKLPLFVSGAGQRKFWWLVNLKGNFGHTAFFRKWEQYKYLSWKNNSFHWFKGNKSQSQSNKWNVV